MPQRLLTLGLLWLATAALLALWLLLWTLREVGGAAVSAALVINALLLPLPALGLAALRRQASTVPATPPAEPAAAPQAPTGHQLLDQVSREIRTPMNAVMGMTQLALQTPLSPEQRELLTQAGTASRTLLALVDDAQDIARIEAGQMAIEQRPLRLEEVVAHAVEQVRPVQASTQAALICDWADASLLGARGQLIGDALRLQQLLANLLSSALRATPQGQVMLRLTAHPSDAQGRVPLSVTVQDSPAAQVSRLLHDAAAAAPGLGLVLARQLLALMGGTLDAQPPGPRGGSVEVRLALMPDPQGSAPAPLPPQRLLLADARADSRDATLALLRHLGHAAGLAASTDVPATLAAVARAQQQGQAFDWLLLDWGLPGPGATGAELLARLRREHPALRVAVLMPPGLDDGPAQARALGARALCRAPLMPADLRRLLNDTAIERPYAADAQSLAGLRVLLVEDHPINQEIALRLLTSRGAVVDVAGNGQEGLAQLQHRGPAAYDLVLMDLQMPVLDGLSATRRLRELPGFEHLPVLAMTAHALPEEKAQCRAAGMQGHIAKPLDVALLVRELQRYRPRPAPAAPRPPLDLALGLRQFSGQATLYRRTLQGFADQYADGLARWPRWLAGGDWADLRRAAHTLQGLAATLGAQPLHEAALALERSTAAGDAPGAEAELALTRAALQALQAEIAAELARPQAEAAPPAHVEPTPPDEAAAAGRLQELRELLAQSDSRALDWWQAHGAHCGLAPHRQQRIDQALAALDFDAAAALGPLAEGDA